MKKKLDALYKAFESYIKKQPHFDIVYSEKYGYVWISFDKGKELLSWQNLWLLYKISVA